MELNDRFESNYVPIPEAGCWLWTGFTNAGGYGRTRALGRKMLSHRLSWVLHFGEIPNGKCVLHKCDTAACVNPAHLFLGSKADNNADKVAKGRQSRGSAHSAVMTAVAARGIRAGRGKLTDAQVKEIRADSRGNSEIARVFGVTPACIWGIRKGGRRPCVN